MDILSDAEAALGFGSSTPAPATSDNADVTAEAPAPEEGKVPAPGPLANLAAAVAAVAPKADAVAWSAVLAAPMRSSGMTTANRGGAFLGETAVESAGFTALSEDLTYSSASRILAVFPSHFASEADAEGYVRNAEALANRVYANRLGNGDESSGDGYAFRGAGLIQITGRETHTAFAAAVGRDLATCPDWCRTPEGAAASACWWWCTQASGLNALADAWEISAITRKVNGPAMLGNAERIQLANAARDALNSADATS